MKLTFNSAVRRSLTSAALAAGIACVPLVAQDHPVQPDNTKVNKRDRSTTAVTADKQKMNAGDRELTQKIRKQLIADKNLSTYAHNVKIVSQNGKVTLKGPVRSDEEKKSVVDMASSVAGGADKIDDQLSVQPASK